MMILVVLMLCCSVWSGMGGASDVECSWKVKRGYGSASQLERSLACLICKRMRVSQKHVPLLLRLRVGYMYACETGNPRVPGARAVPMLGNSRLITRSLYPDEST
jgi:hypothetical protein